MLGNIAAELVTCLSVNTMAFTINDHDINLIISISSRLMVIVLTLPHLAT